MNSNPLFPYPNIHTHKARHSQEVQNCFPEDTYDQGVFSVGIHPCYIKGEGREQWEQVVARATHPLCVAIGECGLDKRRNFSLAYLPCPRAPKATYYPLCKKLWRDHPAKKRNRGYRSVDTSRLSKERSSGTPAFGLRHKTLFWYRP